MKVLITGTAGFVGFHVANKLLRRGDQVIGLDNINNYYDVSLKIDRLEEAGIPKNEIAYMELIQSKKYPNYQFLQLNIEDYAALVYLFREHQFDIVVHLAAQAGVRYSIKNPSAYVKSNVVGFSNILECCRNFDIKHLVYASSSSVYGMNQKVPFTTSDNVDHPISLYAATKKSNELMAHTYSHLFGLPTTGLRFFTVYGPWGRPDMAYFLFTHAILNNKPIKVFNHGNMSRDFTYVDDIVYGVTKVIDHPPQRSEDWDGSSPDPAKSKAPYRIYNIGNNSPVKLMDFIEAIEAALGKEARKEMMPMQAGDVEVTYADVSALKREFGYEPQTSIQTGISRFVDWYKKYYGI